MHRRLLLLGLVLVPGDALAAAPRHTARPIPALLQETLREFVILTGRRPSEVLYVGWARVDASRPRAPYAWWPADGSLLNLTPFDGVGDLSWLRRKARIDLKTDVVADEREMRGSTFLVTRAWAERVRRDCARGERIVVRRPGPEAVARLRRKWDGLDPPVR